MSEGGLIEAWSLWFNGIRLDNYLLWGHPILWWGRLGKIIQFVAAFTIIAEIVGPQRIRKFGKSLHNKITLRDAITNLRDTWAWKNFFFVTIRGSGSENYEKYQAYKRTVISIVLASIITIILLYYFLQVMPLESFSSNSSRKFLVLLILLLIVFAFILSIIITLTFSVTAIAAGMIIDFVLVEPLAWILDREHLDKWVKIASVILLLVGFHFDLLSS